MTSTIVRLCLLAAIVLTVGTNFCHAQYNPATGRFQQRDPVATGLPTVANASTWYHGQAPVISVQPFGSDAHYADGMNLYQYVRSNPVNRRDPLGTTSVMDDYDAAIVDVAFGHAGTKMVLEAVQTNVWRGLRLAGAYMRGAFAWDQFVWDQNEAILFDLIAGGFLASACFPEGTMIWMADGTWRPIEQVQVGDKVKCDVDPTVANGPEIGEVAQVFTRPATEMIELEISGPAGVFSIRATPEHPFYVPEQRRYVLAKDLSPSTELSCANDMPVSVLATHARPGTSIVWNFEVRGAHNYYVGDAGSGTSLLVHNVCTPGQVRIRIDRGQAPRTVTGAHPGHVPGDLPHLHFEGTRNISLAIDGTWRHGSKVLTSAEKAFIQAIGWALPR